MTSTRIGLAALLALGLLSGCDDGGGDGGGDPVCGNGTTEQGEACDDGNTTDGDGCSASCQTESATSETSCTNGTDDDGDGDTDCDDADCAGNAACQSTSEDCATPGDEDGDGAADCDDTDCAEAPACQPTEDCATPGDEDGDGDADCDDTDCATAEGCFEVCDDGTDNDGDGDADCDDADCSDAVACEAVCGNGEVEAGEACDDGTDNSDTDPDACRNDCTLPACGDGVTDTAEQCDSGDANSDTEADACRTTCELPTCGDSVIDGDEGCDDGDGNSDTEPDACRTTCQPAGCGDSVLDGGETCDDGDANSDSLTDACRTSCERAGCGDGVRDTGESCDNGADNGNAPDACRLDCRVAGCGDGIVDGGEACDSGAANSDTEPGTCRTTCVLPTCGDGVVDDGEECDTADERSDTNPDACRLDCRLPTCGDNVVDRGEGCDTGDRRSDTEPDACRSTCEPAGCGDGIVDGGEACDTGDDNSDTAPDACRTSCQVATCGDSVTDSGEACDSGPGNSDTAADSCRTSCQNPTCGDGVTDTGEACDNAAANSDTAPDACRTSCQAFSCGDGVVDSSEACDLGRDNSDEAPDTCRTNCATAHCGDSVIDAGEQCDDGDDNGPESLCGDSCVINHVLACRDLDLFDPATTDPVPTPGRLVFTGDLSEASDDLATFTSCVPNVAGAEQIVVFIAEQSGTYRASTRFPGTAADTAVTVLTACNDPASAIACGSEGDGTYPGEATFDALAGRAYYVVVEAANRGVGPFVLEIAGPLTEVAPRIGDVTASWLTASRALLTVTGSDTDGDLASALVSFEADPGLLDAELLSATYDGVGNFVARFEVDVDGTLVDSALEQGGTLVVEDAAGLQSEPVDFSLAALLPPTEVGSGEACDPDRLTTVCAEGLACTRQSNGSFVCGAPSAPILSSATLQRVNLSEGELSVSGFDRNGDVVSWSAELFDDGGAAVGTISGFFSATLLGDANFAATVTTRDLAAFSTAVSARIEVFDATGLRSNAIQATFTRVDPIDEDGACDPTGYANLCAEELACSASADGSFRCTAPAAPVLTQAIVTLDRLDALTVERIAGSDANADVARVEFVVSWNGERPSATFVLEADLFTPTLEGRTNFAGRASELLTTGLPVPYEVTVTLFDGLEKPSNSITVPLAEPGDLGTACSQGTRAVTAADCRADDGLICGFDGYCVYASAPTILGAAISRTDLDQVVLQVEGEDVDGDATTLVIDALDADGQAVNPTPLLLPLSTSGIDFSIGQLITGLSNVPTAVALRLVAVDALGYESEPVNVLLPLVYGRGEACTEDRTVGACGSGDDCLDGFCPVDGPVIESLAVRRLSVDSFALEVTGTDADANAIGLLVQLYDADGAPLLASPAEFRDIPGLTGFSSFEVGFALVGLSSFPTARTIEVRVFDALPRVSLPAFGLLPGILADGEACDTTGYLGACNDGSICSDGVCVGTGPTITALSVERLDADTARLFVEAADADANIVTLRITLLDVDGAALFAGDFSVAALAGVSSGTEIVDILDLTSEGIPATVLVQAFDAAGNASAVSSAPIPGLLGPGEACTGVAGDPICNDGLFCTAGICATAAPIITSVSTVLSDDASVLTVRVDGVDLDNNVIGVSLRFLTAGTVAFSLNINGSTTGTLVNKGDGTWTASLNVPWTIPELVTLDGLQVVVDDATFQSSSAGPFDLPLLRSPGDTCDPAGVADTCLAGFACIDGVCSDPAGF